ncbi:MAG: putative serine/threonine protein phosphatase [Friedmanniella sp.]|nr:putative serine/threonine protein phosphatase [Friedmanniella sp.]
MTEPPAPAPSPDLGPAPDPASTEVARCPVCLSEVRAEESFCEACGAPLRSATNHAVHPAADPVPAAPTETLTEDTRVTPIARPCPTCGGVVGTEGYCETCGTKAPVPRDHYTEQPASWVAACCDRGVRHTRNEDATAVAADLAPGSRAVLVVCDGVSTSTDSDVASLAAARTARHVLTTRRSGGVGTDSSRAAATAAAIVEAATRANEAVIASTDPASPNAASCTFAAAVVEGDTVVYGNAGDSRVYWIPDRASGEDAAELSLDDSVAQVRIALGVPREEAENGPQAHAITKWLGRDSTDFSPRTGSVRLSAPGWVLVCSDGLWNYVSEAENLQTLVADLTHELGPGPAEPLPLAQALVRWANDQGGKDNVSVALARH